MKIDCLLISLYQRPDALGAQHLANHFALFENTDSLQIRLEGARGSLLGPGTITTKHRFLATMFTLCHNYTSFCYNPGMHMPLIFEWLFTARFTAEKVYHNSLLFTSYPIHHLVEECYDRRN